MWGWREGGKPKLASPFLMLTKIVFVLAILLLFAAGVGFFIAPSPDIPVLVQPGFNTDPTPTPCMLMDRGALRPCADFYGADGGGGPPPQAGPFGP